MGVYSNVLSILKKIKIKRGIIVLVSNCYHIERKFILLRGFIYEHALEFRFFIHFF